MKAHCPYAAELAAPGEAGGHYFCVACPDAQYIPQTCDGWNCARCHRICPCHEQPGPARVRAHERYWQTHVPYAHRYGEGRRDANPRLVEVRGDDP